MAVPRATDLKISKAGLGACLQKFGNRSLQSLLAVAEFKMTIQKNSA
jgi:hypothetical protein